MEYITGLSTLLAYSKNHIATLNLDKIENILNGAVAKSSKCQNLANKSDLNINAQLVGIMSCLASMPNTGLRFKQKFLEFAYNLLKLIYKCTYLILFIIFR